MKIKIPKTHLNFYKNLYYYLKDTPTFKKKELPFNDLCKKMVEYYLDKNISFFNKKNLEQGISNQPTTKSIDDLEKLHETIYSCQQCFLGASRKQAVELNGNKKSSIFVLTDIPSFYDQLQGEYFKDESGHLLIKILKAINLELKDIYYTAAIKCSSTIEISNQLKKIAYCKNHFINEIKLIKPQLILAFGKDSYQFLMEKNDFSKDRGAKLIFQNTPIIFTHHPKEMLIQPLLKKESWNDLKPYLKLIHSLSVKQ